MQISFSKYQGTGNDFILINQMNEDKVIDFPQKIIALWCNRHFGIGADGLILLREKEGYEFEMLYYNCDGNPSTMCGNGGRCAVKFAFDLGICREHMRFLAVDGVHSAIVLPDGTIELSMSDVDEVKYLGNAKYELQTGSPHYVEFVDDLKDYDVVQVGRSIRYSDRYSPAGINVNLVSLARDHIQMLTYERGVENETLSCGTGVTAAAIASTIHLEQDNDSYDIPIHTKGGLLKVKFKNQDNNFKEIRLCGPGKLVFQGSIKL